MTIVEFARKGGKARAAKLTKERRVEIARNAGIASRNRKRELARLKALKPVGNKI